LQTSSGAWYEDYRNGTNRVFIGMKDSIRAGFYGTGSSWDFTFNSVSGNVGVGMDASSAAGARLSVRGNIYFYGNSQYTGSIGTFQAPFSSPLLINAREGNLLTGSLPDDIVLQYSNGAGASTGDVGIGVPYPEGKLHISDAGATQVIIGRSYSNSGYTALSVGTSAASNGYSFLQSVQSAGSSWGNIIINENGGNVGIGTSTVAAGYKLSIAGKAMCEELKVQLRGNWPDYVFAKEYRLKTFDELRNFIAANNHLPNMPAATQIEKEGLEVGDMQRRMTEKIEELTLYMLQLQEQCTKLQMQVEQLNKQTKQQP
jgi:hypothetical protein